MRPVTVALLATLLPACLLILSLLSLSIYLFVQLRLSRARKDTSIQTLPEQGEQPTVNVPIVPQTTPLEPEVENSLSDEANPEWKNDFMAATNNIGEWGGSQTVTWPVYDKPGVEESLMKFLDAIGYQGRVPSTVILQLLRSEWSQRAIVEHIVVNAVFARTSIESPPESTLLPFSPELQKNMATFFKAIEGIKLPPELSSELAKAPSQIALAYGKFNEERVEKMLDHLSKFFSPFAFGNSYVAPERVHMNNGRTYRHNFDMHEEFARIVTFQMRMLGSRRQFELRWPETNESVVCELPALYSHAGEDGEPLSEPKAWYEARTIEKDEAIRALNSATEWCRGQQRIKAEMEKKAEMEHKAGMQEEA